MTTPPPALFVREHVQAPENRLNLALFALLNVPAFHAWFLRRLGIPDGSVVYPPQNVAGGRPDFVAVHPGGDVLCWIEVELGPPDRPQLTNYRTTLDEPVMCIAGTNDGALALGEIADNVRQIKPGMDKQQKLSARVLLDLIGLLAGKAATSNYADPEDPLKQELLIAALSERPPRPDHLRDPTKSSARQNPPHDHDPAGLDAARLLSHVKDGTLGQRDVEYRRGRRRGTRALAGEVEPVPSERGLGRGVRRLA